MRFFSHFPSSVSIWSTAAVLVVAPFLLFFLFVIAIAVLTAEFIGRVTGLFRIDLGSYKNATKPVPTSEEAYNDEIERLLEAANQGDKYAQTELGALYEAGYGDVRSYEEALRWYRIAASQGEPWAHLKLGKMFEFGFGVKRDEVQAFMWCELAREIEHMIDAPEDHDLTEEVYRVLKRLKRKMTDSQIEEARALVEDSLKKSCL